MTKTLQAMFTGTALVVATLMFSPAQAANMGMKNTDMTMKSGNMNMKSCDSGSMSNRKMHGCSDYGHHRGHHKMKRAHHMMKKY